MYSDNMLFVSKCYYTPSSDGNEEHKARETSPRSQTVFERSRDIFKQLCFPGCFNHKTTYIIFRLQRLTLSRNHINDLSSIHAGVFASLDPKQGKCWHNLRDIIRLQSYNVMASCNFKQPS